VTLRLPNADLRALVAGESIIAFVAAGAVTTTDTVALEGSGSRRPSDLKAAYRRWADASVPAGTWTAAVEAVHPAAALDPHDGAARHVLAVAGTGDVVVLKVSGPHGQVLTDAAYAARRSSLESAIRA